MVRDVQHLKLAWGTKLQPAGMFVIAFGDLIRQEVVIVQYQGGLSVNTLRRNDLVKTSLRCGGVMLRVHFLQLVYQGSIP